ncbi:MATE efflux family protein [Coccidioides posadasii C735 delta SOWgp]|uniref:MATE efflux family protein n=1 Tax=Coccidioides posadasii (strain C735) TaxID=222929 RepID=C5PEP7_COCP7|nr:MATE efflux family protein [Coccidioides posadasii C735 delta SOWgp]EER24567.1 MATE efflux family protein [Coccidioides posadasii C735 delta SOWgp]|eukprot:XP_003066712.1 MATE efflux family protein [Coccidioides posadasii C735 delta SOWgp]
MPSHSTPYDNLGDVHAHDSADDGLPGIEDDGLLGSSPLRRTTSATSHSLAGSYRRPSFFTMGARGTVVPHAIDQDRLTQQEWEQAVDEERDLLIDNNVLDTSTVFPPEHRSLQRKISGLLSQSLRQPHGEPPQVSMAHPTGLPVAPGASERTALLGPSAEGAVTCRSAEAIDKTWEEAVEAGLIHTTWKREAKVLAKYTAPLMVTFLLQYSLTVASIFTVGHLGKIQLGAVSLASMTANITGYAIYQGLATSLDTLCAQAYGSGRKDLVGLQMQRMIWFLWTITIPIGFVWFFADKILMAIVPEKEVAILAGQYLKVVLLGAPGYACFEAGKRFVQAQGLFSASLFVLLFCAPLNAFMNWLFVWHFELGFVGAPLAVAITDNLLPLLLFLYVYFIGGRECWNGFTRRAFSNWGPMVRLALPGFLMVEAEVLAFELLTLASSYFGTTALAAQSVLATISSIAFQIPFPLSIAGSTRIANLIGATLTDAARTSAKVNMVGAVILGVGNITLLSSLRNYIPFLFTSDPEVAGLVAQVLPLCASFQLFDALATNCNGILRGLGRQSFGGYVQLFCYYGVALPISFGTAFGLEWHLWGLWGGVAVGLLLVGVVEGIYLTKADWERSVDDARKRNAMA